MGCNCGGKKAGVLYEYVVVNGVGVQKTYAHELQAKAAVMKEGGSYTKIEKVPA